MGELNDKTGGGTLLTQEEEEIRSLLAAAGPRPEVPRQDLEAIEAAFRAEWQRHVERRRTTSSRRTGRWLALAAGLLAAVGAGWWLWPPGPTTIVAAARVEAVRGTVTVRVAGEAGRPAVLAAGQTIPPGAVLETAPDDGAAPGSAALRLADGASARFDAGSEARMVSSSVLELAHGAIYIDSGAGARRAAAVEVRTAVGVATDVGTQFEVRLLAPDSGAMRVRVREGMVLVRRGEESYPAVDGTELTLSADGSVGRGRLDVHGPPWEWVVRSAPAFTIEGRTLGEFLAWVGRETGWTIRFADPQLEASAGSIVLHGDLGDLAPDRAPAAVLKGAGLRHEVIEGTLIVRAGDGS